MRVRILKVNMRIKAINEVTSKGSDTLESFLSKVAFESDFRKKSCTCVTETFAIFLLSKETFTIRTCSILASFFRKLLSKATFEIKLSSVSLLEQSSQSIRKIKLLPNKSVVFGISCLL